MTPTLESALSELPAKPRVHELSKRIGISNKELLAALAERGLTIRSASASVPLTVAQEVIQALLGETGTDTDGASDGGSADVAPTGGSVDSSGAGAPPAEIPGDTPGHGGHAINPLFLPPTEAEQGGADRAAGSGPEQPDSAEPARTGSSRRRRGGRSSAGRRPAQDAETQAAGTDTVGTASADGGTADGGTADGGTADGGTADGDAATRAESGPQDETATGVQGGDGVQEGSEAESETDEDSAARGRRRRRGRRGRGRAGETDDRTDGQASDSSTADTEATVDGQPPASGDDQPIGADAGPEDESDAGSDADSDDAQGAGAGNRRRRRRRRRSTGDETPREDDPDNTVVHVREPRLSQASSSTSTGSAEVQGVRGSTRLEAKRQRRRDSRDSSRRRPQILTEAEFLARRESVERVMAVRQRGGLAQVALLEDGILVEHFVSQTGSDSMIGSVFLGKVQNVLPSMEAAFVDIGRGRNAVIYAGEVNWDAAGLNGKARRIETALSSGDTILAQVSKDPVGHKGARLTTQISLPGRFVVYVPGGGATGISRKLPDTERRRLKSIMDRIVPEDAGVIIRTAAEGIAEDELARDVERLKSQWEEITRRAAEKTSAPTQLYAEPGTLIKVVRDLFNSDITRLVVDGDEAYEPVAEYVTEVAPELADRLVRWEGGGPDVFAAYRIDEQIVKALERKVHLPSGGSLVIDRTEAMTVVDVNTGKYTGSGGNLEETVTKNNLEAAEEMVRQLRLRDIGGIIVIDFIDMVLESNRELVLRRLTEALGRDRTRHQVAEVTSLGLVQMTRKRMGTGLVEAFSEPCPHCGGRGIVLHDMPMVATVEDSSSERRTGKARRARGRDADRIDDIVVPRVVEQAVGRRPDPRGPKPPTGTVGDRGSFANGGKTEVALSSGTGPTGAGSGRTESNGSPDREATAGPADLLDTTGSDADELDWIEAAARAGIAAAEDADADDFEAGRTDSADSAGSDERDGAQTDEPVGIVVAVDLWADGQESADGLSVVAEDSTDAPAGADEEQDRQEPARRRRGRRSAGRPAGAPPATQPVDIVVREPLRAADAPEQQSDEVAPADAHSDGSVNGNPTPVSEQAGPVADEPTPPPRRRRAASRPAGPAVEGATAEPLVVTVPAEHSPG